MKNAMVYRVEELRKRVNDFEAQIESGIDARNEHNRVLNTLRRVLRIERKKQEPDVQKITTILDMIDTVVESRKLLNKDIRTIKKLLKESSLELLIAEKELLEIEVKELREEVKELKDTYNVKDKEIIDTVGRETSNVIFLIEEKVIINKDADNPTEINNQIEELEKRVFSLNDLIKSQEKLKEKIVDEFESKKSECIDRSDFEYLEEIEKEYNQKIENEEKIISKNKSNRTQIKRQISALKRKLKKLEKANSEELKYKMK